MSMRALLITAISIALIAAYLLKKETEAQHPPLVGSVTATGPGSQAIGVNTTQVVISNTSTSTTSTAR